VGRMSMSGIRSISSPIRSGSGDRPGPSPCLSEHSSRSSHGLPANALARLLVLMALVFGLVGLFGGSACAQIGDLGLRRALVQSYDLLEAGKLAEAKQLCEEILEQHPNNPLALNNLGAIYVREKDYQRALNCLERALPQARGYKALINRVCDVEGVCLAFRPAAVEYGNHELEPLIAANIAMVKAKFAASQKWD